MTNDNKLPLKLAEVAVQRFNNPGSGVPHHVGLLHTHRTNIERCVALGDFDKIRREQINATRIIKQLKSMLMEMDHLRERIRETDAPKYDAQIRAGRERALAEINAYLIVDLKKPPVQRQTPAYPYHDDDYANDEPTTGPQHPLSKQQQQPDLPAIQCDFNLTAHQLHSQTACLRELESVQRDLVDLQGIFHQLHGTVVEQAEVVQHVAEHVDDSAIAVSQGERHLRQALGYKKAMYPMAGALLGTCLGGPIGMFAGLKMGGLAAVGCGLLGFTGGAAIKNCEEQQVQKRQDEADAGEPAQDAGLVDERSATDRKND